MGGIPFGTVKRLMKESMDKYGIKYGRKPKDEEVVYIRIGEDAVEKLRETIQKDVRKITKKAVEATKDQGRKTITKKEIKLVTGVSDKL